MIVSLDVSGWPALIVGGGAVALRKAETLLKNGAVVTVIAPEIRASSLAFKCVTRAFLPGDCAGFRLVFACTNLRAVNAAVAGEARALGILCNVADTPDESDFANVATVRRGDIEIGISTGGASPALAKHLREKIETIVGVEYALLAEILATRRSEFTISQTPEARTAAWRAILDSDALDLLRAGDRDGAENVIDAILR